MHATSHQPGQTHAHAHAPRLVRWQRLALYGSGALLGLTGAVWLAVHYSVGAGAGELPHPLEAWLMRLHGLGVFSGLFALGTLAAGHIPHGWRLSHRRRWAGQRNSGLALCVLGAALALTGYLLYYFAPENVRPALGWIHSGAGLAMGLLMVQHRRGVRSAGANGLASAADAGSTRREPPPGRRP